MTTVQQLTKAGSKLTRTIKTPVRHAYLIISVSNMGPVGSASDGISYNPDNQMIYVSSSDGNVVKIIDTDTNTVNPIPICKIIP